MKYPGLAEKWITDRCISPLTSGLEFHVGATEATALVPIQNVPIDFLIFYWKCPSQIDRRALHEAQMALPPLQEPNSKPVICPPEL